MSRLSYEDLEIVGFDGTVLVECEAVLPIARHKPSDQFFKLTTDNSHPDTSLSTQPLSELEVNLISFFSRDEIDAYIQEGRLTLLPEAVPAFAGAMVVYVNEELLVAAGSQLPEPFYWQHLLPQIWVTCGHQEVLEDLLNHWGRLLLGEATERLEQFFLENDQELCRYAEHLTDLALCAANDLTLRSRIYLRSGLAVMLSDIPERLDNLYQLTVRHEFPDWSWELFQVRLQRLIDILRIRSSFRSSYQRGSKEEDSNIIELRNRIGEIDDLKERFDECESTAEKYRRSHFIPPRDIHAVASYLSEYAQIRLTDDILHVLAADPLFYYLGSSLFVSTPNRGGTKDRPLIDSEKYLTIARTLIDRGLNPGDVARLAVHTYSNRAIYA